LLLLSGQLPFPNGSRRKKFGRDTNFSKRKIKLFNVYVICHSTLNCWNFILSQRPLFRKN